MKRRAVITGCGIISSIGNSCAEVLDSLEQNKSGLEAVPEFKEIGLKSQVAGTIKNIDEQAIRQEIGPSSRYMDFAALYAMMASMEAVKDSGLGEEDLASERAGCIVGPGFASSEPIFAAGAKIKFKDGRINPFGVNRTMASSCSANLTNHYKIRGRSYSISSACATGLHNVGHAKELIEWGICDVVIAGGADEISSIYTALLNGMRGALSTSYNDEPERASRAYDKNRDGFVISGGGGIVIVEDSERAMSRNAKIYAEIQGYGASSDGHDIIQPAPDGSGAIRAMKQAIETAGCSKTEVDYINTHGTSTPAGDLAEATAINRVFESHKPAVSSTKSLTGHGVGASGVQELIYSLLMLDNGFVTASVNVDELDPELPDINIVTSNTKTSLQKVMTNSFGFGGTNASILLSKV
ncbi:MAG: 3-oxoacyl-[acyl-carrier-protein] synthase-1 [Verrucomicrobiales bacterium]|jgi:3-oxoacyl-[acyl-carrier-protein] synthase-1